MSTNRETLAPGEFYGRAVRARKGNGFTLIESHYPREVCIVSHAHEAAYLCFVLSGGFSETVGLRESEYGPFQVVGHPSGQLHADRFRKEGRCFNIELGPELTRKADERGLNAVLEGVSGGKSAWLSHQIYREFRHEDDLALQAAEALILELLGECGAALSNSAAPRWLSIVNDAIRDGFRERLHLQSLADLAGVHVVHLARSFRRFQGTTIAERIRTLRIDFACRELAHTDSPLIDVAMGAGFADQSHMTRIFQQYLRMTPGEFRANARAC